MLPLLLAGSILAASPPAQAPAAAPESPDRAAIQKLLAIVKDGSYKQGRFEAARDELKALLPQVPSSLQDNVLFYLGKTYYYLNDHEATIKVFTIILDKFPNEDVVTKNSLLARTALDMLKAGTQLPARLEGRRWAPRKNEKGEPIWKVDLTSADGKPCPKLRFRQAWKYQSFLKRLAPEGAEAKAGKELLDKMLLDKLSLRFVDEKSRSATGTHPNNWRTKLSEKESYEFSKLACSLLFEGWQTQELGRVLTLADNVVDGKDYFEAAGSFTLGSLFKASGYDPEKDVFEDKAVEASPSPSPTPPPADEGL